MLPPEEHNRLVKQCLYHYAQAELEKLCLRRELCWGINDTSPLYRHMSVRYHLQEARRLRRLVDPELSG